MSVIILWMDWRVGLDGRQDTKLSLFVCLSEPWEATVAL